ncbi:glycosyltransferase [Halobellus clavatus]|uniref:Glycosyltransferase, catalytic subunit of cellulose synthase and poly-beta-1,6-N-acetylglucosamine synthase n=1 Tax=Halobellus clavatus TaxID=660517 RepID=A0A1H3J442_9EURY|nr:glycosyltransferase [Halobellus clavatus]SDY34721.1 Glycosyltransferase, catalytic subunit of cellulose synthase and poly-beta-1,6-N-acetylglucosamine synthase [Halobellus clavatus]
MRRIVRGLVSAVAALLSLTGLPYVIYLALAKIWDPQGSPADKQPAEPTVSIVLPTYNEERIVENKLRDIVSLDYPMDKVEVVVVDSSDDETRTVIREFFANRQTPDLTLLEEDERRGLAPALNDAYAAASNEMVVKTDCDSKLAADALREAAANLADPDVGAVTGRNVDVLGGSEVEEGYRDVQATIQTLESHLDSTLIFHGPFSAFENEEIVPIDPDSIADDTELALKIRKSGKRVVFDPEIRYKEASHSAFGKRRTQKDRRAMGLIRLLLRNRGILGRYGLYGGVVLPFNWWFMLVSPWLLAASLGLATVTGILLTGPLGFVVPASAGAFTFLGSRDRLGPLQSVYAVFDTQVSLVFAAVKLWRGGGSAVWDVDDELRDAFE